MPDAIKTSGLPINLEDLIQRRTREDFRVEFKAGGDKQIQGAVVRTVCALANDLPNLNGGYIILGIEEEEGKPLLPPRGLDDANLDDIQKQLLGACKSKISPEYLPYLFVESYQGKTILVIWTPAGDNRPYEAWSRNRDRRVYCVRTGPETMDATGDLRRQLLEQAGKIPFDDRRSLTGAISDISLLRVKKFLSDIRSELAQASLPGEEIYRKLRLTVPLNEHEVPRNVALLFFSEDPQEFFSGARIEVVQFGDDAGGDLIEEKEFRGPLPEQIRSCLNYLDGLGGSMVRKIPGQAEVERTVPYPYEAMEEAIVNAVYHRSYETPPEPVKVYLYPDRMEITSYPGPVAAIQLEHLQQGRIPQASARNRRIGELLKDLDLAEMRGTGIPKIKRRMRENGSPDAIFDFDPKRTYFRVILPVHPHYQVLHALREAAQLWATGERPAAIAHLERARERQPGSGALASQLIEYAIGVDRLDLAHRVLAQFDEQGTRSEPSLPYLALARFLLDRGRVQEATALMKRVPPSNSANEIMELAILKKRAQQYREAHTLFKRAYDLDRDNPKLIHEFAQTKSRLAKRERDFNVKKRLNRETEELLRRAIQLCDDQTENMRKAWCWFDLARTMEYMQAPKSEVEKAFIQARTLLPDERRFSEAHDDWKRESHNHGSKKR